MCIRDRRGTNLHILKDLIKQSLPEGDHLFPDDSITDRSSRFLAAEIVREKLMRQMGDELPYSSTCLLYTSRCV